MTKAKAPSTTPEAVFRFIAHFIVEHGYAPTLREVGEGVYLSKAGAYHHIVRLEAQGRIVREQGKRRGIRVREQGEPS